MSETAVRPPSRAELLKRARELIPHEGDPTSMKWWDDMGHSEYDVAWMARVPKPGSRKHEPAFPEFWQEVRKSQSWEDGGWAPAVDYMSARILATLASILALTEYSPRNPKHFKAKDRKARRAAQRGVDFVRKNWKWLEEEPDLTIGFELVANSLLEECWRRGFDLPKQTKQAKELSKQKLEKLSKVPPSVIFSPSFNLGYTIEYMGDGLATHEACHKAVDLLAPCGAMSGSVGSTAYFAKQSGNETAFRFCQDMAKTWGPKRMPCNMPSRLWTTIWLLYHFDLAELFSELGNELKPHLDFIDAHVRDHGLGWSTEVGYGDSDDTAVGFQLLHRHASLRSKNEPVKWALLQQYEREKGFVGFKAENGPSVSANSHVLDAILDHNGYPGGENTKKKVVDFLLERRVFNETKTHAYWTDKWHASPYYATSHSIIPLLRCNPESVKPSVQWLKDTQHADGGWGWFNDGRSSAEETSYALYALAICRLQGLPIEDRYFEGGLHFLKDYDGKEADELHPHLWIGKGLYRPLLVIRAAVITAQFLALKALGRLEGSTQEPARRTA